MKSVARLIPILAVCSLLVAATEPASAQIAEQASAERTLEEALFDLAGSFTTFPCSAGGEPLPMDEGELIEMEGQIYERITLLADAAGSYHFNLNTMPVGLRGVSVVSGEEFRVSENDQVISNQRLIGLSGSYREEIRMVGRDTHRAFSMVVRGNYLLSADGDIIVSRSVERVDCRA